MDKSKFEDIISFLEELEFELDDDNEFNLIYFNHPYVAQFEMSYNITFNLAKNEQQLFGVGMTTDSYHHPDYEMFNNDVIKLLKERLPNLYRKVKIKKIVDDGSDE